MTIKLQPQQSGLMYVCFYSPGWDDDITNPSDVFRYTAFVFVHFDALDGPSRHPAGHGMRHFMNEHGDELHRLQDGCVPKEEIDDQESSEETQEDNLHRAAAIVQRP